MLHQVSTLGLANLCEEEKVKELDALVQQTEEANGSASAYPKSLIRAFERATKCHLKNC